MTNIQEALERFDAAAQNLGWTECAWDEGRMLHVDLALAREDYQRARKDLERALLPRRDGENIELRAEVARLRNAIRHLQVGFAAGRDNAAMMFGESGSMYHEGRRVAYDQAVADACTALSGESND